MKEETAPETHVSQYKKKIVEHIIKCIKEYPIIGAVNLQNLPAPQLQTMRKQLRDKMLLVTSKRSLIKHAIEDSKKGKPGIEKLEQFLKEIPALLFTKENPFKIYKTIQKSKSSAPAKAGQEAPYDLVIPAGPTAFAPGPIIGELGMLGIKTGVEGGKVAVIKDSVIAREGEIIKPKVAELLARFGIAPMEIGLNLIAVYENGTIYKKDILAIDETVFMKQLQDAHTWAFNLAVEAGYYTKDVVEVMVPKAFNEAKALAKEANIMCDLLAEEMVEQAERNALSLKADAKIETSAAKAPKPKAEAPKEGKKAEEQKPAEPAKEKPKPRISEEKKIEKPKPEPKPAPKQEPEEIKGEIKEKEEEIKEDVEKIEEEIKEEEEKPEPETEKIEEEVKEVEEDIKELEQKKEQLKKVQEKPAEEPEEIAKELSQGPISESAEPKQQPEPIPEPVKIERPVSRPSPAIPAPRSNVNEAQKQIRRQDVMEGEKVYEKLMKTGTLREEKKEEPKPRAAMSPSEILEEYRKKKEAEKGKEGEKVPSAHELLKKKQEKQ
jgi:large subunit ribosomal protein L10